MTTRSFLCGLVFLAIACGQLENTWNVTGFQKSDVSAAGTFTVYWMIEPNGKNITIGIEVQTTNWVGFGISPSADQARMVGSDAFVGDVANGVVSGQDYYLSATQVCTAADGVCADAANGHQNNVQILYGEENGGVTRIKFRRPVAASDPAPYDIAIPDGSIGFVAAIGSAAAITSHSSRYYGGINFYTGAATAAPDTTDMRVAHGYLMFFAWGVILPLGSGIARWAKKFGWWFNIHRLLQSVGVFCSVAAFVLAVEFSTSHFDTNHKIIGLTVLCLALIQPPLGILADKWFSLDRDRTPVFPDYVHWIFGWSAVILGLINTAIGLYVYLGAYTALVIAYIAWAAVVTLVLGITAVVMAIKYRGETSH